MSENKESRRLGPAEEPHRIGAHRQAEALPPYDGEEAVQAVPESAPVIENPSRSILGSGSAFILLLVTVVVAGLLLIATHGGHTEYERHAANSAPSYYMGPASVAPEGTPVSAGQQIAAIFATSPRAAAAAMGAQSAAPAAVDAAATEASYDDMPVVVYLFNYDSYNVPENEQLTRLASALSASGRDVAIVAYADPRGSAEYNQRLSERRAAAIGDYLAAHGVDRASISAKGGGTIDAYPSPALDRRAVITPR